jgi:hypothetical protein
MRLVKSLANKNYKSASVAAFEYPLMKEFLVQKFYNETRKELKTYSKSKSLFRFDGLFESLATYRSADLLNECKKKTPLTYGFVTNTSRKTNPKALEKKEVLALSALLNTWVKSSKFIYRNNVILTVGGCKGVGLEYFHKLGEIFIDIVYI